MRSALNNCRFGNFRAVAALGDTFLRGDMQYISRIPSAVDDRYRLLVESITDYAIYMLDPNGIITNWNAGAARFKGYAAEEVVGKHFSIFYTEEERSAGIPEKNLAIAASEGRIETEGWRVRKDGERLWAHIILDRIRGPDGELLGFAKITRDLTERKQAEEALRRSEEQFRLLVKGVTDYAIYMLDPEGYIISWNAGAERIKGYAEEEIIGEHYSRFYGTEERERGEPQRNLEIAKRDGRLEREGWRFRKDSSKFWAHVIIDPIVTETGQLIGFAKITRDITERREAQAELETAREALFQAQKMEALGQLTGGVAHDFNNLLMAVLGSLELVRKRMPSDPKIMPFIDNATQAAQRGAALTQRMLAFARRQELKMEPVDVITLVRGMSDLLERALGSSAFVSTRFPLSLPWVLTDPAQLETALLNIALNARDAMPEGGTITIEGDLRSISKGDNASLPDGEYVVLAVSDTGEGMDDDVLARAAEPFFTTKGVGKGTGLGLSMVHGLAEQSHGKLVLSSTKGEGTTAQIWLPAIQPAASVNMDPEETKQSGTLVLAVDDDPLVLMNTAAMLEDMGYSVLQATSGDRALRLVEEHEVAAIVTDQAMPKMKGTELVARLRAAGNEVPVVIATGYADLPDNGDLPVLNKPFSQRDLALAVRDLLGLT